MSNKNYYRDATIGLIILVVILGIVLLIYQVIIPSYDKKYEEGYNQGLQEGVYQVISLVNQGSLPYFDNSTGNLTIKTISIAEVCGGGDES